MIALLLPYLKKFLIYAALVAGIFAAGFTIGGMHNENGHLAKDNKAVQVVASKAAAIVEKKQEVADVTASKVEVAQAKVEVVYKVINKEVIKYVQSPVSNDAIADSEWVLLYNASSLGCDVTESTCRAQSEVSAPVTRAEALQVAVEQHRLYRECSIRIDGWIDFYESMRRVSNDTNANSTE